MLSFRAFAIMAVIVATFILNTRVVLADDETVTVTNSSSYDAHVGLKHGIAPYGRRIKLKPGQSGSLYRGEYHYGDMAIYVVLTTPDEKTVCKNDRYFYELKQVRNGSGGLSTVVIYDKCVFKAS